MREIISLHVGQAGIQIGEAVWEMLTKEHGISADGALLGERDASEYPDTFFHENSFGHRFPRAVLVDTEPSVMDEVRTGPFRGLYHPEWLVSGEDDSAGCFARGYNKHGLPFVKKAMGNIRRILETCDGFEGFVVTRSICGGTGSGIGSLILQWISDSYGKDTRLTLDGYPSPNAMETLDPYNAVLALQYSMEYCNVCFLSENEKIGEICKKHLGIEWPTYTNMNRFMSQLISGLTSTLRFECPITISLRQFETNLVPFPRLHFPFLSYAPMYSFDKGVNNVSIPTLLASLFHHDNQLIDCDTIDNPYIAISLLFRGDFSPHEINQNLQVVNGGTRGIEFIDWAPAGFKTSLCPALPRNSPIGEVALVNRSIVGALNSTAIQDPFFRIRTNFNTMYEKRAFLHHYLSEGMDETDIIDARDSLAALERDFDSLHDSNFAGFSDTDCHTRMTMDGRGLSGRYGAPRVNTSKSVRSPCWSK